MKRSFRIVYNIHCTGINYYDKEIIVRNVEDEWDAKYKLTDYCKRKYGSDGFISIEIRTVKPEIEKEISDKEIFGSQEKANQFMDFFKEMINKKK